VTLCSRHLQDDHLFDSYFADRHGGPIDGVVTAHLADCRTCGGRYAELTEFLDSLRDAAEAEADALFTPERLYAQQRQIARRLEHLGHPARVIKFPRPFGTRTMMASTSRRAPRWTAAAAAAGLFVGVALGASYKLNWHGDGAATRPRGATQASGRHDLSPAPLATNGSGSPDVASDAAFLSDLEKALDRPRSRELQALDALTPHVREVRDLR
jgi:hypothetical protein